MAESIDNKALADKIKGFINERISKPVKQGVDILAIVKKLKDRKIKKGKNA